MNIAKKIKESNGFNAAVSAAEKEAVEIKGSRTRPYYKFVDGSSMTVNFRLGLIDIDFPRKMMRKKEGR